MTAKPRYFKVYLRNLQTLGAMCGYGEGKTKEEAVQRALDMARQSDPNAKYDGREVCFSGGANC
jgi:hypothetical protein